MNKKFLATVVLSLFLVAMPFPAAAQAEPELASPGLVPGNFFYFFDRMFEGLGSFLTFSEEAKVERYLSLADERLAEIQVLADQDATSRIEKALDRYQAQMQKATAAIDDMKDAGEEVERVSARVAERTLKHLEVLAKVYEQVPTQAKAAIERAMQASSKGQSRAIKAPANKEEAEVAEDAAQRSKEEIQQIQKVRERGVPVPQTQAERSIGSSPQDPRSAGQIPAGPPEGAPAPPPPPPPAGPGPGEQPAPGGAAPGELPGGRP